MQEQCHINAIAKIYHEKSAHGRTPQNTVPGQPRTTSGDVGRKQVACHTHTPTPSRPGRRAAADAGASAGGTGRESGRRPAEPGTENAAEKLARNPLF